MKIHLGFIEIEIFPKKPTYIYYQGDNFPPCNACGENFDRREHEYVEFGKELGKVSFINYSHKNKKKCHNMINRQYGQETISKGNIHNIYR